MIETVMLKNKAAAIYLNRPEKRNALNSSLLVAFIKAIKQLDESIQTLYILGRGEDFCTGMDLAEALDLKKNPLKLIEEAFRAIINAPQITIACVTGRALGGGAGIALAADFLLLEEEAIIAFPEVQRGIVPGFVAAILKDKVPMQTLKELLLLSKPMMGKEAVEKGIAMKLVKKGSLLDEAEKKAKEIQAAGPIAIKETKAFINRLYHLDEGLSLAARRHEEKGYSKEAEERIKSLKTR